MIYSLHVLNFNPRPPWGGRRGCFWQLCRCGRYFNPRPPWGGRHGIEQLVCLIPRHFNPRPPWGGRLFKLLFLLCLFIFQSTPSVGRATHTLNYVRKPITLFQSTPSVGRATTITIDIIIIAIISIHALRGEGDCTLFANLVVVRLFQSTPSVGRATAKIYKYAMLCLYIVHIKLYIFATAVLFI